jgi:hypothetical protein
VQPDLPTYFIYDEGTGQTGNDQRDEVYEAAWERAGGLDKGLLRAIVNAAKIPGGAVVFLDHDDADFPGQWEIERLASGTPARRHLSEPSHHQHPGPLAVDQGDGCLAGWHSSRGP